MNLYEMNNQYQKLLDNLYDEEGHIDNNVLHEIENNEITIRDKSIQIAAYINNIDAEAEAINKAISQMENRQASLKSKVDFLKRYLLDNMQLRNIEKITCPYFEIKVKKCPPSVDIYDEFSLPDEYKRVKEVISPDKATMLNHMKNGVVIPGASLKYNVKLDIK